MNARASENYLAISRSSSPSKSVEIFWAEIYWGRLFLGPNLVSFNRALVATSADSVPSSYLVRITIAPIGTTFGNLQ